MESFTLTLTRKQLDELIGAMARALEWHEEHPAETDWRDRAREREEREALLDRLTRERHPKTARVAIHA